jgi:type II secretory pathway component GspD/PulD (secretin)
MKPRFLSYSTALATIVAFSVTAAPVSGPATGPRLSPSAGGASKPLKRLAAPNDPFVRSAAALAEAPQEETFSSLDRPGGTADKQMVPAGEIKLLSAELNQVLDIYQELSGRTVMKPESLPPARVSLRTQTPLTRREALQALDTALALNGIAMVLQGAKFVKAVPLAQAPQAVPPTPDLKPDQLPESSSYLSYTIAVKHRNPADLVAALQPHASAIPSSIVAVKEPPMLILRDFSANVRRMLQVIEQLDKPPREAKRAAR